MSIFLIGLTLLMLLVIYFDLTSFTIPNWLNAIALLLFIPFILSTPHSVDWQSALLAFGVVFAIGFFIFAMNWMGGGDIKLFIATAPWLGWGTLLADYLILVAILGGILSILLLVIRKIVPWILPRIDLATLPRLLRKGEPVPYGLAIAGAFLYYMWTGQIAGIAAYSV